MRRSLNRLFSFSGKREVYPSEIPGGPDEEMYMGMDCQPVKKMGGYSLSKDDPKVFRDKNQFITQDRAFPKEQYPEGADPEEHVPQSGTGPSTSTAVSEAAKERELSVSSMARMHTELLKMARQMGIEDLCAVDKANRVENVLAGITRDNLTCKYCKKTFSSVTNLKNHIKGLHLHKTAHYCAQCRKYFSEATALKRHKPKHDADAKKYRCGTCAKDFTSQSRLDDHMDVHREGSMYRCQYCQAKDYRRIRALKAHEITCLQNPSRPARVKCRLCPKDFKERRVMKRHFASAHPGEDPDL